MTMEYKLVLFKAQTLQDLFLTIRVAAGSNTDMMLHAAYRVSDIDGSWDPDLTCGIEGLKEDGQYSLYSILKIPEVEDDKWTILR